MLFIDQPVNVGFSYSDLTDVTMNVATGEILEADFSDGIP